MLRGFIAAMSLVAVVIPQQGDGQEFVVADGRAQAVQLKDGSRCLSLRQMWHERYQSPLVIDYECPWQ
jgi:hypothetical protein